MPSSIQVLPAGFRVLNTLGQPASGAQIQFFQAGTTTPRTVYADAGLTQPIGSTVFTRADGLPAANQGSSTVVTVWTGIGAYKVQILDAAGNVLYPAQDNISGALDTSQFLPAGSSSVVSTPVITPVSNTTLVAGNKGQVVDANTSGGSFTLTLDFAVNLGNGWNIFVRNGGANPLTIAASGGQLIAHPIGKITAFSLRQGEGFHISCDGASFRCDAYVPPLITPGTTGVIQITDIVSVAPVGPAAGARYIVGTAFGGFTVGTIIEASGAGTFFSLVPPTNAGWVAYVQSQSAVYIFTASAWRTATFGAYGQCRLTLSGANLLLSPFAGNLLTINGIPTAIPDAGVQLAITGAAASTFYYIYAFLLSGVMTLEFSTTAPAAQAGTGIRIKSGDATRTLVGAAFTTAVPAWADASGARYVLSWFNRRWKSGITQFTTNRTTTSAFPVELNAEIRNNFISWSEENVRWSACGSNAHSIQFDFTTTGVGFDGTAAEAPQADVQTGAAGLHNTFGISGIKAGLTEAASHYATLLGGANAATGTWFSASIALNIEING